MADEPSKTPGILAEHPFPQMIPLSKIHDLPGMFIQKHYNDMFPLISLVEDKTGKGGKEK